MLEKAAYHVHYVVVGLKLQLVVTNCSDELEITTCHDCETDMHDTATCHDKLL